MSTDVVVAPPHVSLAVLCVLVICLVTESVIAGVGGGVVMTVSAGGVAVAPNMFVSSTLGELVPGSTTMFAVPPASMALRTCAGE